MPKMTEQNLQADWIATQNIARFQERLDAETDDGRIKILMSLLAREFETLKLGSTQ
jgi:hypothetical protein